MRKNMKKMLTLFCLFMILLSKNAFPNPFSEENGNGFLSFNANVRSVQTQNRSAVDFELAFGAAFFNKVLSITFFDLGFTNKWGYAYKPNANEETTYSIKMLYLGPRLAFTVLPTYRVSFSIGNGGGIGWFSKEKIKDDSEDSETNNNSNDFITYYDIYGLINIRLGEGESNPMYSITPSLYIGLKRRFVWNSQDPHYPNKELGGYFFVLGITAMFGKSTAEYLYE
jgi:hypothetical protein